MNDLTDRTVIVTGGARGLGASAARHVVAAGADVVITDILADEGRALAAELGPRARFLRHDVTSEADWRRVADFTAETFGGIQGTSQARGRGRRPCRHPCARKPRTGGPGLPGGCGAVGPRFR